MLRYFSGRVNGIVCVSVGFVMSRKSLLLSICLLLTVLNAAAQAPTSNHVFVTVIENADYNWVVGNPAMPYLNSLISQYGLATQYFADTHPSIGNYYVLTTGQVVSNDDSFTGIVSTDNLVRELNAKGKSWKSYAEDLPEVGWLGGNAWPYSQYHNPFASFSDVVNDSAQLQNLVPMAQFWLDLQNNQLPNYSYLLPNAIDDAHSCPDVSTTSCTEDQKLANADQWLQANIGPLIASPIFQQDGILLITFDEAGSDNTNGGGQVVTLIISPMAKSGYQSTTLYQHESGLRLTCDILQITCPGAAANAPRMDEFFLGDVTPPMIVSVQATSANSVNVVFSEVLDSASATNVANYSLNNSKSVTSASLGPDNRTVTLVTSSLAPATLYTITINHVSDVSRNAIAADTQGQFLTPGDAAQADYRTTVAGDLPISYWRLGENNGTVASDLMGRNTGVYSSGVTLHQAGALPGDIDSSVLLDSSTGFISVANSSTLNVADGPFTLEAWVKRNSANREDIIFHKGTGAYQLRFNTTNHLVLASGNTGNIASSTTAITDSYWHHCVATKSGADVHLYLDGIEVTGTVSNLTLGTSTGSLRMGTDSTHFFNGELDEMAIYGSVLSLQQVTAHYSSAFFPAGPSSLAGTPVQPSEVNLIWTNHAANAQSTSIERSLDGISFSQVASMSSGVSSYSDTGLTPATSYFYRVRSINGYGSSAYSNTISLSTSAAQAPDELVAMATSSTQIALLWIDNAGDYNGFYVERSRDGVNFQQVATSPSTNFVDSGLQPGTLYSYRVRSYNAIGTSAYSNIAASMTEGATASYQTNIVADSPISYWSLDETSGSVAADTMTRNPGSYSGGYTLGLPGALGVDGDTSVLLDGSTGFVSVPAATSLNLGDGPLTLEAWVKRTGSNRQDTIIHKGTGAYQLRFDTLNRLVLAKANTADIAASNVSVTDSNWHHCVATKDGTSVHIYLDGVDVTGVVTNQILVDDTEASLRLGDASSAYYLYGGLDDIAIYNYALAPDRVAAHYSAAHLPLAPTALSATSASTSQINLAWTNKASNASGSYIERSLDGTSFVQVATVGASISSYSDDGLNSNTSYTYRVRAFNGAGASTYSNAASAATASLSPTASLAPTGLTYSSQLVGTTSVGQAVVLNNTGSVPLSITSISVTGDYMQTNTCGSSLAAGASCTIDITFTPTQAGTGTGTLAVTDNAPGSPQTAGLSGTGVAAAVSLIPLSLSFSDQLEGTTSAAQAVVLSNTGTAPLSISSITGSGDYAQTNNCGATLAAGANCTINVTFTPALTGTRNGTISVTDNAAGSPQVVSLSGYGIAPAASLSPLSFSFGNQLVGTTSGVQISTLSNRGTAPLSISIINVTGDYAQTNNCGTSLAVGASCNINVTFSPTVTGARSGTLSVTDNASGSPQTASLSGNGIAPAASLSPFSLSFGNQLVATTSAAQTVTLSNTGTAPLSLSNIGVTGDYAQTNNCGVSLAAGASCSINVSFTPTATGARSGNLSVTDNASGSPQITSLGGTGTAPAASLAPSSLSFGNQLVGTTSVAQAVILSNSGTAPLSIISISLTGDYAQNNNCGTGLPIGTSCTINVTFLPTVTGSRTGTLSVMDNASGSPQTTALNGTGAFTAASLSPSSLTFSSQSLGTTSVAHAVTLSNTGTAPLSISSISISGDYAQSGNCSASLPAGTSCTISVTFTPTSTGTRTGTLTVMDNASGSPQLVSLSGTGVSPVVKLSPPSVSFGKVLVGTASAAKTVSLANTGIGTLVIKGIGFAGTNATDFSQTNNCGASLAPGAKCAIQVTFRPLAKGTRTGSLIVQDNAPNSPQSVSLSGTGQ